MFLESEKYVESEYSKIYRSIPFKILNLIVFLVKLEMMKIHNRFDNFKSTVKAIYRILLKNTYK